MFDIWDDLKDLRESFTGKAVITNWVFRLHYMATTVLFAGYSILVTMNTYVGDPIDCMHDSKHKWGDYFDTYCFLHGTTSFYNRSGGGIGHSIVKCGKEQENCEKIEHPQYMWISFMVIAQAGLSYLPYYLWNGWEGGRMASLVQPLRESPEFEVEEADERSTNAELCKCGVEATNKLHSQQSLERAQHGSVEGGESPHLFRSGNQKAATLAAQFLAYKGHNVRYAVKHGVCESICVLVSFLQIALTDFFLNEAFSNLGPEVVANLSGADVHNPLARTFPIVTSCNLRQFGGGGHETNLDAVCVLPNNIVHQKFYLFLWFWLFAITIITLFYQLYRICLLTIPAFRKLVTKTWWTPQKSDLSREVDKIVEEIGFPDWVVLSLIHSNLTTVHFQDFLKDLAYQHKPEQETK